MKAYEQNKDGCLRKSPVRKGLQIIKGGHHMDDYIARKPAKTRYVGRDGGGERGGKKTLCGGKVQDGAMTMRAEKIAAQKATTPTKKREKSKANGLNQRGCVALSAGLTKSTLNFVPPGCLVQSKELMVYRSNGLDAYKRE